MEVCFGGTLARCRTNHLQTNAGHLDLDVFSANTNDFFSSLQVHLAMYRVIHQANLFGVCVFLCVTG